jgi:hypothetical protein
MDALQQPGPRSAKILSFDGVMGSSSRKKAKVTVESEQKPALDQARGPAAAPKVNDELNQALAQVPNRWERWLPIAGSVASVLIAVCALVYTVRHDNAATAAVASDDHVKNLINEKLEPIIAQLNQVTGQLNQMNWQRNISELQRSSQGAPGKELHRQTEVMADLRANLAQAQKLQQKLPLTEVVQEIQQVPTSAKDYWTTVAAIINYQSFLNQLEHNAPDPETVAKPCAFATESPNIRYNTLDGTQHFTDCLVDLDTNANMIENAVIKDSVVRYYGGVITFQHATFINCRFVVDIKASQEPTRPDLLLALMNSDQTNFKLPAAG